MIEPFDIGVWLAKKLHYNKIAGHNKVKLKQIIIGEIWMCDLGVNIGEEKTKVRPVVVVSNNKVNRTGKVIVAPITDAKNKVNNQGLPQQNTWLLMYTQSPVSSNWYSNQRSAPASASKYSCLKKDSVVQCEELRSLSKARMLNQKIGDLTTNDLLLLKKKMKNVFDII